MDDSFKMLYKSLHSVSVEYLTGINRNNIKKIKELTHQIQQFVMWFLAGNKLGIEQEEYQKLSDNLLQVLKDIVEALEQEDYVLLHDAIAYGLLEYLELFMEREDKLDDSL